MSYQQREQESDEDELNSSFMTEQSQSSDEPDGSHVKQQRNRSPPEDSISPHSRTLFKKSEKHTNRKRGKNSSGSAEQNKYQCSDTSSLGSPHSFSEELRHLEARRPLYPESRKSVREPIDAPPIRQKSEGQTLLYFIIAVCVLTIALLLFIILNSRPETHRCTKITNSHELVRMAHLNISRDLPTQDKEFWYTLKSQLRHLTPDSKPSCMLLATPKDSTSDAVTCISRHLQCLLAGYPDAEVIQKVIVTTVDDPEKINSMKLSCETKDYSVLGLDVNKGDPPIELPFYGACGASRKFPNDALLEMERRRVAVIERVELLELDAASILYLYCDDNVNPKHPGTMLFLTVEYSSEETVSDDWVRKKLNSWSTDSDKLSPLLSRVGNNLLILKAGESKQCSL